MKIKTIIILLCLITITGCKSNLMSLIPREELTFMVAEAHKDKKLTIEQMLEDVRKQDK